MNAQTERQNAACSSLATFNSQRYEAQRMTWPYNIENYFHELPGSKQDPWASSTTSSMDSVPDHAQNIDSILRMRTIVFILNGLCKKWISLAQATENQVGMAIGLQ